MVDMKELGVAGERSHDGFRSDEWLPELRGPRAIKKYREMRDNDPIIGALMTAMDMMLRAVKWRVDPADDSEEALEARDFAESLLHDMNTSFETFISEVLTFLPFGFSFFEIVYKKREGPEQKDPTRRSRYNDGRIGVRKLAPRAQWTIERFRFDERGGITAVEQTAMAKSAVIPIEKGLLFRTAANNGEPTGRSVLRNAYRSYYFAQKMETIEAIAVERELNGLPVGRMPATYLGNDLTTAQQTAVTKFKTMLRDVKFNEQGYMLLPSDLQKNEDGSLTDKYIIDFQLMASQGTRDIEVGKVIIRHQQNMARTVLADFLMLGQSERGSFALSKSKTDLFLRSLEGYIGNVASTLNQHLLPRIWQINGLNPDLLPKYVPGDVAPVDLEELGNYIRSLSQSGMPLFPDEDLENDLRGTAGLPDAPEDPDVMGVPDE